MSEIVEAAQKKLARLKEANLLAKIEDKLFQLKRLTEEANRERVLCGMTQICAQCGAKRESCCAQGVEFKYSLELIMINLYFGVKIPYESEFDDMCFFLTKNGCRLFVRDVFCINFICEKITRQIPSEKINRLRQIEGFQLDLQFKLEDFLKKL